MAATSRSFKSRRMAALLHAGTESLQTRRWRGVDSNRQYRVTRQRFREGVISAPLDSPPTESSTKESRHVEMPGTCAVLMVRIRLAPAGSQMRTAHLR